METRTITRKLTYLGCMMKALWICGIILVLSACQDNGMAGKEQMTNGLTYQTETFTRQNIVPGVHSNLRSIWNYSLTLTDVEVIGNVEITALVTDSLVLPLSSLKHNDMRLKKPYMIAPGTYDQLQLSASQNVYQEAAPNQVDPVVYERIDHTVPEGKYQLQALYNGQVVYIKLSDVQTLDRILGQ